MLSSGSGAVLRRRMWGARQLLATRFSMLKDKQSKRGLSHVAVQTLCALKCV